MRWRLFIYRISNYLQKLSSFRFCFLSFWWNWNLFVYLRESYAASYLFINTYCLKTPPRPPDPPTLRPTSRWTTERTYCSSIRQPIIKHRFIAIKINLIKENCKLKIACTDAIDTKVIRNTLTTYWRTVGEKLKTRLTYTSSLSVNKLFVYWRCATFLSKQLPFIA